MPKVRFETGQVVNFESMPSQADIDEVAGKLGIGKKQDSIATMGASYLPQHPFKSAFEPISKTATGSHLYKDKFTEPAAVQLASEGKPVQSYLAGVSGDLEGMLETPATYATLGLSQAGKVFGGTKIGQAVVGAAKPILGKAGKAIAETPVGKAVGGALHSDPKVLIQNAWKAAQAGKQNLPKAGEAVKRFFDLDRQGLDLAAKTRGEAARIRQDNVDKFGGTIKSLAEKNPDKNVSLRNVVEDINQNVADMSPEAKNVFRKTPELNKMLKNPELADNVSLGKAQEIINYIDTKVPANIKYNHLDIMDALSDIKASQLDAFPEMAGARADYGNFKNDYKLIKNALKPGSTVNAIRSNFSDNVEVQAAAKRLFSEDMIKEMGTHRGKIGVAKFLKRLVTLGVAGVGGKKIIGK